MKGAVPALGPVLTERPALWREPATHAALATLGPLARDLHPRLIAQFRVEAEHSVKTWMAETAITVDRDKSGPALTWLRNQLKSGNQAQRAAVARALAKVDAKNPDVLNWLLVQSEYANTTIAAGAIQRPDLAIQPALPRPANDPSFVWAASPLPIGMATIADEGLRSIGLLGESGKPASEYLRKAMAGRDKLRRVRAALSLWQVDSSAGKESLPVLGAALSDKSTTIGTTGWLIAAEAAAALGEMGAAATTLLPALNEAKANGDLLLSTAAAAAIRKIRETP
jgi:hypothetical protein